MRLTSTLDETLMAFRQRLLARIWAGGALIALIVLATTLAAAFTGNRDLDLTGLIMASFIVIYFARHRIPFQIRVALTLILIFGAGLDNFVNRGMFGAGYYCFVITALIAAMLHSVRAGVIAIAVASLILIAVGYGFVTGSITPAYNFNLQAGNFVEWVRFFTVVVLASSLMLYSVGTYIAEIQKLLGEVHAQGEQTRKALEDLKKSQAQVLQLEKLASLGSLVAGVAHELNTPLGNSMLSISSIQTRLKSTKELVDRGEIRRSTLDSFFKDSMELAAVAVNSSQRAASLIASFKQIAADQTTAQRRTFVIDEVIADMVATLLPTYRDKPWQITTMILPLIKCDSYPGPLGQVLTNLVQNAFTHAFVGKEKGVVHILATESDGNVVITVQDDGVGIEAVTLPQIFNPFFTTCLGQGTSGLGLSIAHNITVNVLGGTLQASSVLGQGTQFVLRFPAVAPRVAGSV